MDNATRIPSTRHTADSANGTEAERGQVVASAAEVYEQFFVPALFGHFAPIAVDRSGVGSGDRLVDVACGTGVVARRAASVVGSEGTVVGVDVNPAMLTVARALNDDVDWIEAPAESLPFESGFFDAAVCQFGLMFFTDNDAALGEMARVVRPGRPVVLATWADMSACSGYEAMIRLLDDQIGSAAAEALRAPFTIGTESLLAAAIEPAFDDHEVWTERGVARFPSLESWMRTEIRGWTLSDMIDDDEFDALLEVARSRLARFVQPSGAVTFELPAIMAIATVNG